MKKTKQYNDQSANPQDWTTKKLKKEAISLDYLINVVECYGRYDLMLESAICNELDQRGYEGYTTLKFRRKDD